MSRATDESLALATTAALRDALSVSQWGRHYGADDRTLIREELQRRELEAFLTMMVALERAEFQLARLLTHENSRAALPCLDEMRAAIVKAREVQS